MTRTYTALLAGSQGESAQVSGHSIMCPTNQITKQLWLDRCFPTRIRQPLSKIPVLHYSIVSCVCAPACLFGCQTVRVTLQHGSACEMSPFNMLMFWVPMVPLRENLTFLDRCVRARMSMCVCVRPGERHCWRHIYSICVRTCVVDT